MEIKGIDPFLSYSQFIEALIKQEILKSLLDGQTKTQQNMSSSGPTRSIFQEKQGEWTEKQGDSRQTEGEHNF